MRSLTVMSDADLVRLERQLDGLLKTGTASVAWVARQWATEDLLVAVAEEQRYRRAQPLNRTAASVGRLVSTLR